MRALRVAAVTSAFALAAVLSAASAGGTGDKPVVDTLQPPIQAARSGPCIADPATMRRDHPDMLKHQRDQTVHQGVRDQRTSLQTCIGCHASAGTGSVAVAKTDFCISCHSYAAVKVDCFECHASKPQASAFVPLHQPMADNAATRPALWRAVVSAKGPGAARP